MIDYIKFQLTLAISFQGMFYMRREETFIWNNTFWNLVWTIVD